MLKVASGHWALLNVGRGPSVTERPGSVCNSVIETKSKTELQSHTPLPTAWCSVPSEWLALFWSCCLLSGVGSLWSGFPGRTQPTRHLPNPLVLLYWRAAQFLSTGCLSTGFFLNHPYGTSRFSEFFALAYQLFILCVAVWERRQFSFTSITL